MSLELLKNFHLPTTATKDQKLHSYHLWTYFSDWFIYCRYLKPFLLCAIKRVYRVPLFCPTFLSQPTQIINWLLSDSQKKKKKQTVVTVTERERERGSKSHDYHHNHKLISPPHVPIPNHPAPPHVPNQASLPPSHVPPSWEEVETRCCGGGGGDTCDEGGGERCAEEGHSRVLRRVVWRMGGHMGGPHAPWVLRPGFDCRCFGSPGRPDPYDRWSAPIRRGFGSVPLTHSLTHSLLCNQLGASSNF